MKRSALIALAVGILGVAGMLAASCGGRIASDGASERPPIRDAGPALVDQGGQGPDEWDPHKMDGFDAGVNPFVGTWHPSPDPSHCPLRVAADPAHVGIDWNWEPCPSGRPGCRELIVDWGLDVGDILGFSGYEPVRLVNGKLYAVYRRWYYPPTLPVVNYVAEMHVVQQIDGPPVFAIGGYEPELHSCVTSLGVGEYGVGLAAMIPKTGELLAWAPWSHPTNLQSLSTTRAANDLDYVFDVRVGTDRMFMIEEVRPSAALYFQTQTLKAYTTSIGGSYPHPVPGGLLSFEAPGIIIRRDDDAEDVLVPGPPWSSGRHISSLAFDRTTNTILWVESSNQDFSGGVLWKAPLALFPQGIVKRQVTGYEDAWRGGGRSLVANAGMALMPNSNQSMLLVRLSDGWGWNIPSEPGQQVIKALWVTDDEVAVGTTRVSWSAYKGGVAVDGILRIARSTLGPPDVPPSL